MGDEEFTKYCEEMKTQRLFHIKHSFFFVLYINIILVL